ncbi:MAG: M23 family peptidase, partial [Cyanobacteria bacterium J06649_11]
MNNEVKVADSENGFLHSIFKAVKANIGLKIALGIVSAVPVTLATVAAEAAEVQINPPSPRLGDTISVIVTPDDPSNGGNLQVTSNGKTYPVFPIAPNQYRAFIPTTPLEKYGRRVVRVSGERTRTR